MELTIVIFLVILGLFLLVAEILLLPGVTVALIGAILSFISAIVLCYFNFGLAWSIVTLGVSIVLSIIVTILSVRKKTLKKISLSDTIDSSSSKKAETIVAIGAKGIAQTRLAPMGMVLINGNIIEAKTYDGYVDAKTEIYVTGYDDSVVIVSIKNNS